jgi:hypothetical protein
MNMLTENYRPAKNMTPFFDITRKPLKTMFDGREINLGKEVILSPKGDVLGFVAPTYNIVMNEDVANIFDEHFSNYNVMSIQDKISTTGEKWMREYILNDSQYSVSIGNDDEIKTKIVIYNGYDAKTAVGFYISAWRQVCGNGMMGWKKMIGKTFGHFSSDIIPKLKGYIDTGFIEMKNNFGVWEMWKDQAFKEGDFHNFIDGRKYLSDKKKEKVNAFYTPIMNKYKENETKWGAYNVLTAIASHHITSRDKEVAQEFSNGYREMVRITRDFWETYK